MSVETKKSIEENNHRLNIEHLVDQVRRLGKARVTNFPYRTLMADTFMVEPGRIKDDPTLKETIIGIFSNDLAQSVKKIRTRQQFRSGRHPYPFLTPKEIFLLIEKFGLQGAEPKTASWLTIEMGVKSLKQTHSALWKALTKLSVRENLDRFVQE